MHFNYLLYERLQDESLSLEINGDCRSGLHGELVVFFAGGPSLGGLGAIKEKDN